MLIGPEEDPYNEADEWEPAADLRPLSISRGGGSAGLPRCEFAVDLAAAGTLIVDGQVPRDYSRTVAVWLDRGPDPDDDDGGRLYEPVFFGEIVRQDLAFGSAPDDARVLARMTERQVSGPLAGPLTPTAAGPGPSYALSLAELPGWPLEFNPRIEGTVVGNRYADALPHPDDASLDLHAWQDPGTDSRGEDLGDADAGYFGPAPESWTHEGAVAAACRLLNPDERCVDNPDEPTADPDPDGDGVYDGLPELADVTLPPGTYLPGVLDALLRPYGLDWTVDLSADPGPTPAGEPPAMTREIRVYRHGRGPERTVSMPRPRIPGETPTPLTAENSTAAEARVSVDVGEPYTAVTVYGAARETESLIVLERGWPVEDDGLSTSAPGADAWRLWVANEDGRYCGSREGGPAEVPDAPPDWSGFGVTIARRRRLGDRLTVDADGRRLPPELFFRAAPSQGWYPAPPSWTWSILPHRAGVRFSGDVPPQELVAAGDGAGLAVLAGVVGDELVSADAGPSGRSPAAGERRFFARAPHRFRDDRRDASHLEADGRVPGVFEPRDDAAAAQSYADELLRQLEPAAMDLSVQLVGLQTTHVIGDLLTEIEGRGVSLDRSSAADDRRRYAQVVGLRWSPEDLTTDLQTRPSPG